MPILPVHDLLSDACRNSYAVGYFESWDLDSLLAVASAAEALRSPVLLGFSGIYMHHPQRLTPAPLEAYAAMGLAVGRGLSVPCNLLFNESPHYDQVLNAAQAGFGLVMFSDENLAYEEQLNKVSQLAAWAHPLGVAVEGEASPLPGVGGELDSLPLDLHLTDPRQARQFVEHTGVDALAVNIGQVHLHGRRQVHLDLDRLSVLKNNLPVPLVLHGASSVYPEDLQAAIRLGVSKVNLGSRLKRVYFEALRQACLDTAPSFERNAEKAAAASAAFSEQSAARDIHMEYNPYHVIGSGLPGDVQVVAHLALKQEIERWMVLYGSAGKA